MPRSLKFYEIVRTIKVWLIGLKKLTGITAKLGMTEHNVTKHSALMRMTSVFVTKVVTFSTVFTISMRNRLLTDPAAFIHCRAQSL